MMKSLYIIVLTLCATIFMVSCDKVDDNGDLGGMWQCTEWKSLSTGEIMADKQQALFYSVQLKLIKFSIHNDMDTYHLARFNHRKDSLIITKVYSRPFDKEVSCTELAKYGVPSDGRFAIAHLSSSKLVLKSKENIITFRKY